MPPIGSHQSTNSTKLMLLGESGAGKSGALASLVTAGYKLRILDFDNGLDTLKNYLTDPTSAYAKEILAKGIDLNEAVSPAESVAAGSTPASRRHRRMGRLPKATA